MKHLMMCVILCLTLLVSFGTGHATAQPNVSPSQLPLAFGFTADTVARLQIEDWRVPSHPYFEAIKLDGSWVQLAIGTDGFTAEPTHAHIDELINAVLGLQTGELHLDQPPALDLDSRDGTMTPVHFCAILIANPRIYRAVCSDEDANGKLWLATFDSTTHFRGFFELADDSAVLAAMQGL
jgi:hypothetical protein